MVSESRWIGPLAQRGRELADAAFLRSVSSGRALIIRSAGSERVVFTAAPVFPWRDRAEEVDISVKSIAVELSGREGILSRDPVRFDVRARLYVRVDRTPDGVLRAAAAMGAHQMSDVAALADCFVPLVAEALRCVAAHHRRDDIQGELGAFKERVFMLVAESLHRFGYEAVNLAMELVRETASEDLQPETSMADAMAARAAAEVTCAEAIRRNQLRREAEMQQARQDAQGAEERAKQALAAELAGDEAARRRGEQRTESDRHAALREIAVRGELQSAQLQQECDLAVAKLEHEKAMELASIQQQQEIALARIELERRHELGKAEIARDHARLLLEAARLREEAKQTGAPGASGEHDAAPTEETVAAS